MRIGDVCEFKTKFEDADFWLIRKGSETEVGKPVKTYSSENIGVKVIDTEILNPSYLYYVFMHLHQSGKFITLSHGTTKLKNISISDIKNIPISFQ